MAERPLERQGSASRRLAPLLILLALLLGACATPQGESRRLGQAPIAGNWVTIQRGDTLGALARRADVPLARLERFNPGVDARRLAVGQRLLVPTANERAPSGGPYRYQIRPGDTYSSVARHFGTTSARIQAANPGQQPNRLRVGQVIQVPLSGGAPSRATASRPTSDGSSSRPAPAPSRPDPGDLPSSARNWPWPLDDYRVIRHYGTDSRGTLQPMLLATGNGARAKAVADGEVRFAGGMRQLGQVVIVHHDGNLQSVYAQCDQLSVEVGRRVSRGSELCRVGRHGETGRHDLLFDLRHGGKPIDPRRVLR
ncbi:M23 family metallopeptidase [Halomonas sp. 328]|uniref:M23 family metallopeptidase n=1 Tax=Halomonas sp. 328 TaxID=2776704 RepID=UPI0018A70E8B|nr:M23 family metallopeptidase [Halomonas sp. 328]MBF8222073.1 M23 family metallopeptidase [Halomonas sp. 328]